MMKQVQEFAGYTRFAKLGHLEMLLPEVVEEYGKDSNITLILFPENPFEEYKDYVSTANKVVFKKDTIEFLIAADFDIAIEQANGEYKAIRRGYLGFGGTVQIKQNLTAVQVTSNQT